MLELKKRVKVGMGLDELYNDMFAVTKVKMDP